MKDNLIMSARGMKVVVNNLMILMKRKATLTNSHFRLLCVTLWRTQHPNVWETMSFWNVYSAAISVGNSCFSLSCRCCWSLSSPQFATSPSNFFSSNLSANLSLHIVYSKCMPIKNLWSKKGLWVFFTWNPITDVRCFFCKTINLLLFSLLFYVFHLFRVAFPNNSEWRHSPC